MDGSYYTQQILHTALAERLAAHGLNPTPAPRRHIPPAGTFHQQLTRIAISGSVLADLQRRFTVGPAERGMIVRLIDAACLEHERNAPGRDEEPHPDPLPTAPAPRQFRSSRWSSKGAPV
jgi:hypothetical protein